MACGSALLLFLAFSTLSTLAVTGLDSQIPLRPPLVDGLRAGAQHEFTLRHIFHHGSSLYPNLHRKLDIPQRAQLWVEEEGKQQSERATSISVQSQPLKMMRLADRSPTNMAALHEAGRDRVGRLELPESAWTVDEIYGPNITDKKTLISMARVASNAYILDNSNSEWEPVRGGYNYTEDFGWEGDGLRGHIFADTKNETVIIGLKGTSLSFFGGSGSEKRDKENDNLLFSCCCGQGWFEYKSVCDCKTGSFTCNNTCVSRNLREKPHYYWGARHVYTNVTALYPDAEIWLVGHSLGGAVCSLLGATYGNPAITFEAPPDAMAASRLGLPTPPRHHMGTSEAGKTFSGVYHFGHTADPLYMGECSGEPCAAAGFAMQSKCHTGHTCTYNTTKDLGWSSHLINHRISTVVHQVIEAYNETAPCTQVVDCLDCKDWKYYESNGTATSTTSVPSTSTTSTTSTTTCETPGWWGCRDKTTTTTTTTTTTSSSSVDAKATPV